MPNYPEEFIKAVNAIPDAMRRGDKEEVARLSAAREDAFEKTRMPLDFWPDEIIITVRHKAQDGSPIELGCTLIPEFIKSKDGWADATHSVVNGLRQSIYHAWASDMGGNKEAKDAEVRR